MKTTIIAVIVAFVAAFSGFTPVAVAQGTANVVLNPTISSLNSDQFYALLPYSAYVVKFGTSGNGLSINSSGGTYIDGFGLNTAQSFKISFFLSQTNGSVSMKAQIVNGIGVSFDPQTATMGSSLTPIMGLAFFMVTNSSSVQGSVDNVYIGGSYIPNIVAANPASNGNLLTFNQAMSSFNTAFELNNASVGNRNDYYVLGLTTVAVPEPASIVLASLGGVGFLFLARRKK